MGTNCFISKTKQNEKETQHKFDYSTSPSFFGGQGLVLKYKEYQGVLSPWRTMEDEVRVFRPRSKGGGRQDACILLGMGSIAWSGGYFNSQPFCLVESPKE